MKNHPAFAAPSEEGIYPKEKSKRRKTWLIIISVSLLFTFLTLIEYYLPALRASSSPTSSKIFVFVVININLILLIALFLLILRHLVKLYFERKSRILGARFKTKLVIAFVGLSLIPSILLFTVARGIITSSIENWFDIKIERSLDESLEVAWAYYKNVEQLTLFFAQDLAQNISNQKMLSLRNRQYSRNYLNSKLQDYNLDAMEVFDAKMESFAFIKKQNLPESLLIPISVKILKSALSGQNETEIKSIEAGEIVNATAPVWDGSGENKVIGAVAVSYYIPNSLLGKIKKISRSFEEYKQLKLLKNPIKTSYSITLSLITLLIIFSATWVGIYLAKSITIPIQKLAEGTRAVAEGQLNHYVDARANDEIGLLVDSFNQMTVDLKNGKQALEKVYQDLQRSNIELDGRRNYMEAVLESIATGVISLDKKGKITTINKAAERLLHISSGTVKDKFYRSVFDSYQLEAIRNIVKKMRSSGKETMEDQIQLIVGDVLRTLIIHVTILRDSINSYLGIVIVFEDVTELITAQKLAAWREVARRLAHEIKNPLTPIQLSAQRLRKKSKDHSSDMGKVIEEATRTIIQEVDGLKELVNEFSRFARMPESKLSPWSIHQVIEETVSFYKTSHRDILFILDFDHKVGTTNLDRGQIKRALINLLDNSIEASDGQGEITIKTCKKEDTACTEIHICDKGRGIPLSDRGKVFQPYFSTKKDGTGLGLAIVHRIISDHSGQIIIKDNHPRGTCFIIELPN